jgi:hypothetical protein
LNPSPQSAEAAHAKLRDALAALPLPDCSHDDLGPLIERTAREAEALNRALHAVQAANAPDAAMAAAIDAALRAEAATAALKAAIDHLGRCRGLSTAAGKAVRAALAEAIAAAGVPKVLTPYHRCEPLEPGERVEVTDAAALPAQYWRQPEPEPDKAAILFALRSGPVPGARLARGERTVRISNRRSQP